MRGERNAGERVPDERRVRRRVPGHTVDRFRDRFVGDHQGTVPGAGRGRVQGRRVPHRIVEDMPDVEEVQFHVQ